MAMIGLASMTDAAQAQTEKETAQKVETLVAASVLGFVLGIAVPRENRYSSTEYTTLLADTSYIIGRSLAAGDINFALLVK